MNEFIHKQLSLCSLPPFHSSPYSIITDLLNVSQSQNSSEQMTSLVNQLTTQLNNFNLEFPGHLKLKYMVEIKNAMFLVRHLHIQVEITT